jgi:hypothetical protein
MGDEESGSVFGGFSEMVESGFDAAMNVAEAGADVAIGTGHFAAAVGEHLAATGAELVGAQETRDYLDDAAIDQRDASYDSFGDAGTNLSEAYTDVVGE